MALLTKEAEEQIINLLLAEGLADSNLVYSIKQDSEQHNKPVLAELIARSRTSPSIKTSFPKSQPKPRPESSPCRSARRTAS